MATTILNTGTASGSSTGGTLTVSSFNAGATVKSVFVLFAQDVNQTGSINTTSATFGGENLVKLSEIGVSGDHWVAIWGLNNPSSTSGDLVVNYTNTGVQSIICCASSNGYIQNSFLHIEDVIEFGALSFPPNSLGVCSIGSRTAGALSPTNATKVIENNQSSSYASIATVNTLSVGRTVVDWNTSGLTSVSFMLLSSVDPALIGIDPRGDIISHDIITN